MLKRFFKSIVIDMGQILKAIFIFAMFVIGGCSDFHLTAIDDYPQTDDESPDIEVSPATIDFGTLNADGEVTLRSITIKNIGTETLKISDVSLGSSSNVYTISNLSENKLEPDEETYVVVLYNPETYSSDVNSVIITSNDREDSVVSVLLTGDGDAPVIQIEPEEEDMGLTLVGCDAEMEVNISNAGNADLIVTSIDYFVSYPTDFSIDFIEETNGELPWTIEPGESNVVKIKHIPLDSTPDSGYIEVTSNDPITPIATAEQTALGDYSNYQEETFEQSDIDAVDILFVVDNSCSMSSHQTQLANNFDTFMNVFISSGVDYNIAFITTDSANIEGSVINSTTADPVAEVATIIDDIGIHGSTNERGIHYSYYALQNGGDLGPGSEFWRTDSKLIIIYISDEDDHSSTTPTELKSYVVTAKGSADYVSAHAVAGDYPGGCNTNGGADEGYEYYVVVNYLNGTFLSICEDDWGTPLETLAHDSILISSYVLSEIPIEDTLEILVNGVESTDWTYSSDENTVYFDGGAVPSAGSDIYISYAVLADCNTQDTGE
jgi:hypothetical protein